MNSLFCIFLTGGLFGFILYKCISLVSKKMYLKYFLYIFDIYVCFFIASYMTNVYCFTSFILGALLSQLFLILAHDYTKYSFIEIQNYQTRLPYSGPAQQVG